MINKIVCRAFKKNFIKIIVQTCPYKGKMVRNKTDKCDVLERNKSHVAKHIRAEIYI